MHAKGGFRQPMRITEKKGEGTQEAQEAQEKPAFLRLLCFLWFLPSPDFSGTFA
jgi:hypothetical protein